MTPDFALSLSFDGIRLLHRTPDGWSPVGEVPLEARDLAGELAALRRTGLDLGAGWNGTKIVLPNEQIRYLTLDDPGAGDAEVQAALDGATPYHVSDLVIDHVSDGTRTYVAAVARETLEEAETFAAEHGFQPLCFVSEPAEGRYMGEAFFGPTRLAPSILGGVPVTREALPTVAAPVEEALDDQSATVAEPEATRPADAGEPAPLAHVAPPDAILPDAAAAEPTGGATVVPDPVQPAVEDSTPDVALAVSDVPPPVEADLPPLATAASPDAAGTQLESTDFPDAAANLSPAAPPPMPTPTAPLSATGVPQPIFASRARLRREQASGQAGATQAPVTGPRRTQPDARIEPRLTRNPERPEGTPAEGWALSAPAPTARKVPLAAPISSSVSAPARHEPILAAAPVRTKVEATPPLSAGPAAQPVRAETAAATEAARMTVFGERKREDAVRVGGKPRFLGLILTVALLIVMAAVAVLASVSEQGLAGLVRAALPAATEVAESSPEVPSSEASPEVPATETASAAPATGRDGATDTGSTAAPAFSDPDPEASQAAAAAVAAAIGALPASDSANGAAAPDEADQFAAETGVWQRAPSLPLLPDGGEVSSEGLPSVVAAAPQAGQLPALAALTPDKPFTAPEAPSATDSAGVPAPDSPTAPGAEPDVLPDGVRVVAGAPPLVPPTRPALPGTSPAEQWVNAMATPPTAQPQPRPERPVEPDQALAAVAQEAALPEAEDSTAAPGTVTVAPGGVSLASLRPSVRPGELPPEVPQEQGPATETVATFDGPRPGLRPDGLAPELPASPDVSDAVAQALAEPAPTTEAPPSPQPATPDIQSTLATIVANAPDPLAGATARAVAAARVPDARPRNFDRVVRDQLARAARAAQPQQAPRQEQAQRGGVGTGRLEANEQAESGEAEVASAAAAVPSGPTAASVAQAATYADAMALREMNLIGVYGQPNARRALVRMGNGRYLRVGVGDSLDGGQVTAIGENALNYVRRGRTEVLVIPGS